MPKLLLVLSWIGLPLLGWWLTYEIIKAIGG
jgi:hypothetical protein